MKNDIRLSYSLPEAAAATGLSRSSLEKAIREGDLKSKVTRLRSDGKAGKRIVLAADLQAYLDGLVDA